MLWAAEGPATIDRSAIPGLSGAARQLDFAAVERRLAAPDSTATAWVAEGFIERNRHPVFMAWLDASLLAPASDDPRITELDDDD